MSDEEQTLDPIAKGCGIGCLGLVALVAVLFLWGSITGGDDAASSDQYEARAQCEGFADKRLKSPATADYDLDATESNGSWTVIGTVDSENGFGANVRSTVTCVLHFSGSNAVLDDIAIG